MYILCAQLCAVAFVLCDDAVATASADGTARVWNLTSGVVLAESSHSFVSCLAFRSDGSLAVVGLYDYDVGVWDLMLWEWKSCREQGRLRAMGHVDVVSSVQFSPDGFKVLSASVDGTAKVWDLRKGELQHTYFTCRKSDSETGCVNHAEFTNGGRRVVTASDDNVLELWDSTTGAELSTLRGHTGPVTCCSVCGPLVASCSMDRTLRTWLLPL
eukprot:RCo041609